MKKIISVSNLNKEHKCNSSCSHFIEYEENGVTYTKNISGIELYEDKELYNSLSDEIKEKLNHLSNFREEQKKKEEENSKYQEEYNKMFQEKRNVLALNESDIETCSVDMWCQNGPTEWGKEKCYHKVNIVTKEGKTYNFILHGNDIYTTKYLYNSLWFLNRYHINKCKNSVENFNKIFNCSENK